MTTEFRARSASCAPAASLKNTPSNVIATSGADVATQPSQSEFLISPWRDLFTESAGYDPLARDFRNLWTPLLGPAASAIYIALVDLAHRSPIVVAIETLAASIGLAEKKGRLVVLRAIERLGVYGLVHTNSSALTVRLMAPPLSRHQLRRIPRCWTRQIGIATAATAH